MKSKFALSQNGKASWGDRQTIPPPKAPTDLLRTAVCGDRRVF